jgi:single-stranded-DNA-specific exonuclease
MAAGFSLRRDQIENFSNFLQLEFNKEQDKINSNSICEYDAEIISNSFSDIMAQQLKELAPFGANNPEPIFKINNLFIFKTQILAGKHIKCMLLPAKSSNSSKLVDAIAFNATHNTLGHILLSPNKSQEISIIGKITINHWRGEEKLQLIIQDIML